MALKMQMKDQLAGVKMADMENGGLTSRGGK